MLALMAVLLAIAARAVWIVWIDPTPVISGQPSPPPSPPPAGYSGVWPENPPVEAPEPPIAVLVGIGLVGVGLLSRRSVRWRSR
jgi:hypothetical protein